MMGGRDEVETDGVGKKGVRWILAEGVAKGQQRWPRGGERPWQRGDDGRCRGKGLREREDLWRWEG
jgi:hypothetical protein